MKNFTLKNYPPGILAAIFAFGITLQYLFSYFFALLTGSENTFINQIIGLLTSGGAVLTALNILNTKFRPNWLLRLLHIGDIQGNFKGHLLSSYYVGDNPDNERVKMYVKLEISQNLNGFSVFGKFFNDIGMQDLSSTFKSSLEEMSELQDGRYQLVYLYYNEGNQLHADQTTIGLNNHKGVCVLTFDPQTRSLDGYYFNYERSSHGNITLTPLQP